MPTNSVYWCGRKLIDISDATVSPETLARGYVAYDKDGNRINGEASRDSSGGGEYNVESLDNGDGTQTILINTAEGGSTPSAGIDDTILEFDGEDPVVRQFIDNARVAYQNSTSSIVLNYVDYANQHDKPVDYQMSDLSGDLVMVDENTGTGQKGTVSGGSYSFQNLVPGNANRYFTVSNGATQKIGRIRQTGSVRTINAGRVDNVRDLGGWPCDGGTVKYGLLYRGEQLNGDSGNRITKDVAKMFRDWLGIRYEIDIRDVDQNYGIDESPIGYGVKYDFIPLHSAYYAVMRPTDADYPNFVKAVETAMHNAIAGVPTYFHCQAGADRTGTLASVLCGVLGVSKADLEIDYELTSFSASSESSTRTREYHSRVRMWTDVIDTISSSNPWASWCVSAGIPVATLNLFRRAMIDGNPADLDISEGGGGEIDTNANMIPQSVDVYGNPYNGGAGYKSGTYLNSGGNDSSDPEIYAVGYMPMTIGQTIRFENIGSYTSNTYYANASHCKIAVYDSDKNILSVHGMSSWTGYDGNIYERDSQRRLLSITINSGGSGEDISNMAYIRICAAEMSDESAIYIS